MTGQDQSRTEQAQEAITEVQVALAHINNARLALRAGANFRDPSDNFWACLIRLDRAEAQMRSIAETTPTNLAN